MKTTEQKIEETESKLKELKAKLQKENDVSKWIHIKELSIEIQSQIHHKRKSYDDLKEEFGEEYLEEHLPTYSQLQFLRNPSNGYCDKLELRKTWEFVKQEDEISKENGYVARFGAGSGCADLDCGGYSDDPYSYLGVRFVRKKNSKEHK